jgi:hypothetical protein
MTIVAVLFWMCLVTFAAPGQQREDRYFKEDHLTGADYIRLSIDETYVRTGREHMGIWIHETGRWERSGEEIKFVPKDKQKQAYTGTEVSYRRHTFLAFSSEAAPGLVIPVEQIKQRIDADPKVLPSYVFFEIDRAAYERETRETYPFRTRGRRR